MNTQDDVIGSHLIVSSPPAVYNIVISIHSFLIKHKTFGGISSICFKTALYWESYNIDLTPNPDLRSRGMFIVAISPLFGKYVQ